MENVPLFIMASRKLIFRRLECLAVCARHIKLLGYV